MDKFKPGLNKLFLHVISSSDSVIDDVIQVSIDIVKLQKNPS